jgi:thioredoxin
MKEEENNMAVLNITKDQFEQEVIHSELPVFIDFYATWCGPCKMMAPVIDKLSEEVEGVKFISIDVDNAEDIALQYNVSSVPCLIYLIDGEEKIRHTGPAPKSKILEMLS